MLLPAAPPRADLYRWTDAEGVTHYAPDRERVPRPYRDSAELVKADAAPAQGPLPPVEVEPAPAPAPPPAAGGVDAAGLEEPERVEPAPVEAGAQPPTPPAAAPAEAPSAPAEPEAADADPREAELAALERELTARREELKNLISESSFDSSQIAENPRLRELAELVPRLQAEVEALRGELER